MAESPSRYASHRHSRDKHHLRLSLVHIIPCLILPWLSAGFNLEQRLPIVKFGHQHSHFGYSVATHTIGEAHWPNKTNW